MNESCSNCGLVYEVEPGFFIGAMYISYGITVALLVAVGIVLSFAGVEDTFVYIFSILGVVVLLLPLIFRYSRLLYLHMFGGVTFKG